MFQQWCYGSYCGVRVIVVNVVVIVLKWRL